MVSARAGLAQHRIAATEANPIRRNHLFIISTFCKLLAQLRCAHL
jgi:hypothetical protein